MLAHDPAPALVSEVGAHPPYKCGMREYLIKFDPKICHALVMVEAV